MFSCEICEILKRTSFEEHLQTTASDLYKRRSLFFPLNNMPGCCVAYISFFYKQAVFKQQGLGWQIAKQLSGLNSLPLGNNENYRLKKCGVFPL